jgi:predicted AAA+ superfamily ATPase
MEALYEQSLEKIRRTKLGFKRNYINSNVWNNRLTGILGARGAGKTTLMLQYMKEKYKMRPEALYVSLDNLYFTQNTLLGLVEKFVKRGGQFIFIDEVHKYENWAIEIKNIYDTFDELKVVFTGSSMLQIHKAEADLSRRAVVWRLPGLSFREYLELAMGEKFPVLTIDEILANHTEMAAGVCDKLRPIAAFEQYLKHGYYPFFNEGKEFYNQKLQATIGAIIESDVPAIHHVDYYTTNKIKKLLYILAKNVPYQPNIAFLAESLGSIRGSVLQYLDILERADLINLLRSPSYSDSILTKPDKIYLNNTNLSYVIAEQAPSLGNLRETFFLNQMRSANHKVHSPKTGDFLVNQSLTFEVGGRSKSDRQIKEVENSFVASDDLEMGVGRTIPLWLFGMMY